jgi:hypothetical protein
LRHAGRETFSASAWWTSTSSLTGATATCPCSTSKVETRRSCVTGVTVEAYTIRLGGSSALTTGVSHPNLPMPYCRLIRGDGRTHDQPGGTCPCHCHRTQKVQIRLFPANVLKVLIATPGDTAEEVEANHEESPQLEQPSRRSRGRDPFAPALEVGRGAAAQFGRPSKRHRLPARRRCRHRDRRLRQPPGDRHPGCSVGYCPRD